MSVKHGLLALLANGPRHGYVLKTEYEQASAAGRLNGGQVYTTCARLVRDGFIVEHPEDDAGRVVYEITDDGYGEVRSWLRAPIELADGGRDELALKVLLGRVSDAGDVVAFLRDQREATMATLQDLRGRQADGDPDAATLLRLDRLVYLAEAELRWLERAEQRLTGGDR